EFRFQTGGDQRCRLRQVLCDPTSRPVHDVPAQALALPGPDGDPRRSPCHGRLFLDVAETNGRLTERQTTCQQFPDRRLLCGRSTQTDLAAAFQLGTIWDILAGVLLPV